MDGVTLLDMVAPLEGSAALEELGVQSAIHRCRIRSHANALATCRARCPQGGSEAEYQQVEEEEEEELCGLPMSNGAASRPSPGSSDAAQLPAGSLPSQKQGASGKPQMMKPKPWQLFIWDFLPQKSIEERMSARTQSDGPLKCVNATPTVLVHSTV